MAHTLLRSPSMESHRTLIFCLSILFFLGTSFEAWANPCEPRLSTQPIDRLMVEILDHQLDRAVSYQLQLRSSSKEEFDFAELRTAAERFSVTLSVDQIRLFRGNPVVDVTVQGRGRRVVQMLLDWPSFRIGPYWLSPAAERLSLPAPAPSPSVTTISQTELYQHPHRDQLVQRILEDPAEDAILIITSYGKPAFAAVKKDFFMRWTQELVGENLRALGLEENYPDLANKIGQWQKTKPEPISDALLGVGEGSKRLAKVLETQSAVLVVPRSSFYSGEKNPAGLVLFPL